MPSYHDALYAAREAVRDGYQARMDALRADEARERLIAQAWAERPGEVTWATFLADLNDGLPPGAQVKYGTARRYEREGSAKIGRHRGDVAGRGEAPGGRHEDVAGRVREDMARAEPGDVGAGQRAGIAGDEETENRGYERAAPEGRSDAASGGAFPDDDLGVHGADCAAGGSATDHGGPGRESPADVQGRHPHPHGGALIEAFNAGYRGSEGEDERYYVAGNSGE